MNGSQKGTSGKGECLAESAIGEAPSDEEVAKRFIELFRSMKRFFRQELRIDTVHGVSDEKLRCLMALRFLGRSHLKALAAYDGLSASSQCILVSQLVNEGFVLRSDDPADRRNVFYELTESGRALAEEVQAKRVDLLCAMLTGLDDDEKDNFAKSLRAIQEATEKLRRTSQVEPGETHE
jgi:MarR family 2-MHQ and catechol resistance regulon transcriptional repressor